MNRKFTLLGLGICVAASAALTSCGGMWLDSGGMGVSIYDNYGPYWQPGPPPPQPAYGSLYSPGWGWDVPTYYPGPATPPPSRPAPTKPGIGLAPSNPENSRPPQNSGVSGGRPGSGVPTNPNLSRPSSSGSSSPESSTVRPGGGMSGRH